MSCPHFSVYPFFPGPFPVDGEVTSHQRATGGLLGHGVCHGRGHHLTAGLWQRWCPHSCHQVCGGPHCHPVTPCGWLRGTPTPGAWHQPGPNPSWPPLHPVQWVPPVTWCSFVSLHRPPSSSSSLLFLIFNFWSQYNILVKSPDPRFKSHLHHLLHEFGQVTSLWNSFTFCKMEVIVVPLSWICSEVPWGCEHLVNTSWFHCFPNCKYRNSTCTLLMCQVVNMEGYKENILS